MRVNATSLHDLVASVGDLSARQGEINRQLASGVRLNQPSDDAVASGQAVLLADTLSGDTAFLSTASTVGSRMQAADTALGSVVTQLNAALSSAIGAVNQNTSPIERSVAVLQLKSIREGLVSLANSSYAGVYLFAGSSTTPPFSVAADGSVSYSGNGDTTSLPLLSGGSIPASLSGSSLFLAGGASVFGSMKDLISSLESGNVTTDNEATLVSNLRNSLSALSSQRATLNMAQNRLTSETDYVTAQKTNTLSQQTELLSSDPVELATELSNTTTRRSALLNTIALLQKGSIFDYM